MIENFKEQLNLLEKLIDEGREFGIIELLTTLHSADIAFSR
jgi:hypothetical protein